MIRNKSKNCSHSKSQTKSRAKSHTLRGYFLIAAATLFWGISATLGRAVFTGRLSLGSQPVQPIEPLMLAQSRTTISFLLLTPILLMNRGWAGLRLSRREIAQCMLLGTVGVASSNYFYYLAIQRTTVATAIILQYTAPVFVLLYMLLRGEQHATVQRVSGVTLAVVGSVFAIGAIGWTGHFPWVTIASGALKLDSIGVTAALIAAVAFSFYNVFARRLVEKNDRWRVLLYALMGAAIGWNFVNPPWKVMAAHYSQAQWTFLLLFSVCSVLIPFSLYFWGLQYLDATRAIVSSCLEPAFAIMIAAAALGEVVGPLQIVGIVVTLTATVLVQLPEKAAREGALIIEPME
ncbi:MAG TPA: DMT family transporter [Clostridia bacterium]|nr:DMT family transporter [Clostridia bacterium]